MAYQALYRRWRPMFFSEMVGQELVIRALRNQVHQGRVAHAYLFCGSRGTGKTSTAKIFSRAINCEHPQDGDACGVCDSCKRLIAEESLDVIEIDAASNNGVDNVRMLREEANYPPQYGRYKVYIIDEVHMLSTGAFNALLKTLEEPPAYVVFILATTEPQKLPSTILSRCQRYDFHRIPAAQISAHLREAADEAGAQATPEALDIISRAAEGGMRDALSILDMCLGYGVPVDEQLVRNVLGASDRSFLFRFTEALQEMDPAVLLSMIDELMRSGRDPGVFMRDEAQHLRSLLVAKACPEETAALLEVTQEDADAYIGQAQGMTETRMLSMMDLFMAGDTASRSAFSPRLTLESAAMKACLRTGEEDYAALQQRIETLESELTTLREQIANGVVTPGRQSESAAKTPDERPAVKPKAERTNAAAAKSAVSQSGEAVWKEAMNQLKRNSPGTFSFLSMGVFAGCEGDTYRWTCKEGMDFALSYLSKDPAQGEVAAALSMVRGEDCRFLPQAPQQAQETAKSGDRGFLDELEQTFGKSNVIVQDS